jgi:hypothetical protein
MDYWLEVKCAAERGVETSAMRALNRDFGFSLNTARSIKMWVE